MSKKEKKKMRDIPPTPPIEREEIEKEDHQHHTPARAREKLPVVIDIHTPPSIEMLLLFARSRGYTDEAYIRNWFDLMENEYFWCHPVSGNPLNHWPAYFRACYRDRGEKCKGRTAAGGRKADNWRGTKPENMDDVL